MPSYETTTLIVAAAALLAPIVGPAITAIVTIFHERSMYKKRFAMEHEHEAIERYLKAAGKYLFCASSTNYMAFGETVSEIFMYAPKKLWGDIRKLNESISKHHLNSSSDTAITTIREDYLKLCENFASLRRR